MRLQSDRRDHLRCGFTSYGKHDIEHRYCGHCHRFYDEGPKQ
jgi:hypothetical protein